MKKTLLAAAAFALLVGTTWGSGAYAGMIKIQNQESGPKVSVSGTDKTLRSGEEFRVVNFTQHGVSFDVAGEHVNIPPRSSKTMVIQEKGTHPFEAQIEGGPGLNAPSVPSKLKGDLSVR